MDCLFMLVLSFASSWRAPLVVLPHRSAASAAVGRPAVSRVVSALAFIVTPLPACSSIELAFISFFSCALKIHDFAPCLNWPNP
jgi:hypothetical protein